ncbi:MAG: DUF4214 domain-containing protein [Bradymonadia bacterium]
MSRFTRHCVFPITLMAALMAALAACGEGEFDAKPEAVALDTTAVHLESVQDATGIHSIFADGVDLFANVGGYYIIGSCGGPDDPGENVVSLGGDGRTLHAPGGCPGAPYRLTIEGDNPKRVTLEVGPMPVDYATLSVPLDPVRTLFTEFRISGDRYEVGCGASWDRRRGNGGAFDSIPQPCHIPNHGPVGAARTQVGPGYWAEISGPVARIRRTLVEGHIDELFFYNHPYTRNMEYSFGPVRRGETVRMVEELAILPPGGAQAPAPEAPAPEAPPPVSTGGDPLDLLYRAIFWRDADPAGRGTFGPRVTSVAGMKQVAADLLASPEFAGVTSQRSSAEILEQFYRGLLGRALDPSGRESWQGQVQRGEYGAVIYALLDSQEFRNAHPGLADGGAVAPPPANDPPASPPPANDPPPVADDQPPAVGAAGAQLLPPLYEAIFARAADDSGLGTFGPTVDAAGYEGLKQVARQMIPSPEWEARRASNTHGALLDQFYRGLMGRPVDPAGQGTFLPWVREGRYLQVLDALIDSPEFRGRFPGY